jgi:putative acetyltransferase
MENESKKTKFKDWTIREIEEKDNKELEQVIRTILIEFKCNIDGTIWVDPNLGKLSTVYNKEKTKYWIVEDKEGKILGGCGIGELEGEKEVCELQKMYLLSEVRGTGLAKALLDVAINFAKQYYNKCYLETMDQLMRAQKFYEKNGFKRFYGSLGNTGHFSCPIKFIMDIK